MRLTLKRLVAGAALMALATAGQAAADSSQGDGEVSGFYSWTEAVPATPGRLLREEPLPAPLALPGAGRSLRILYSSTDGVDGSSPVAVSGALFLPAGHPPAGGWPLLAWAHGTVGMADRCAPSWAGRSERDVAYLGRWLAEGYAIVASDYQGLGVPGPHPYLLARPAAYGTLDSVRAVTAGVPGLSRRVVLIGQSQGGGAAFAAAAFQPAYAPDLDLRGVVATGVPYLPARAPSPSSLDLDRVDPTIAYTFYLGLTALQLRPAPDPAELFTPEALPLFERARTTCVGPLFRAVIEAGLTRRKAVRPAFFEKVAALSPLLNYPTLKIERPVFVGSGEADRDVRPENQLALVRESCAAGTVVEAHLYRGLDHGGTVNDSLIDSVPFVRRVMAGETISPRCEPQLQ
jgi:hypothetical protein